MFLVSLICFFSLRLPFTKALQQIFLVLPIIFLISSVLRNFSTNDIDLNRLR